MASSEEIYQKVTSTLVEALNRELEQRDEQSGRGRTNARDLIASRG